MDYFLNDDDFDRLSPLTNTTIGELLGFDLSKDEPTQYSTLPYPTLQTRDTCLATDPLINARRNEHRSLAVASTPLRAQRWMDNIVAINRTDRNRIAVALHHPQSFCAPRALELSLASMLW
ncbi:BZ3500_MvSof-1268-A1-R1_Chr1-2g01469 [Microbotryum saponariae]|uniref:BZ3500_MvSof-1268-A1-R1_Chr1-2g01469 protein n=1 Tax=Microbotryum saponariae TaxID=289078 RepID=A0A2X0MBK9_9BASI|nr:BZ3500_MvSof-1268-A1-R1_Chr1-2g01469 [Microbotryum saponariae]SCZ97477.1 BZ3501_MvSof-1269-A2-R1_Chr1-2g01068 [Microbotryum saponariae]